MLDRPPIAICSLSCRYADASSPDDLWTNLMDGRRSFRPIPPERLAIGAYSPGAIGLADSITPVLAGLLTNWHFDRGAFLIPKRAFETTDLTHWLALQLAAEVIEAVGGVHRLDRTRTAVIVANTLTGEFSRAALLRLRQPFLDELLQEALDAGGASADAASNVRREFARQLKERFPEPNEDSLAGGLANTIAGRIANHFDLNGGAYTVDGACSSSLLAISNAAGLLQSGVVDAVVTGAVDLSLDPFELVGFSRNGALSPTKMRVFDARADGFWPGEGGAFGVLMRAEDARRAGFPILAFLRGWGMSTDGAGGLTRPDVGGQMLAYRRAYEMAASDPRDLAYVEAHGTGTAVGDPTEVMALAAIREGAASPLPIGSVKANIGHTKAAAGFAGLIKVVLSLRRGGIPPHAGCEKPHSAFRETDDRLYPLHNARAYDAERPLLAAVSSFGFGGINLHVVLEGSEQKRRPPVPFAAPELRGEQGAELFLFRGADRAALRTQLSALRAVAPKLSLAALADAAAAGANQLREGMFRLAFVARHADQLCDRLDEAIKRLSCGEADPGLSTHLYFGSGRIPQRIGYLFSGQSAPVRRPSSVWLARFPFLRCLADSVPAVVEEDVPDTAVAQPAITYANLAALQVLERFGVEAVAAAGHSLGELAALAWSGSVDRGQALDLAARRGVLMARHGRPGGAMLRLGLSVDDCRQLAAGLSCTVACVNGPSETVMSGRGEAIRALSERARQAGADHQALRVSHAFHGPDMALVVEPFCAVVGELQFEAPSKPVISTVTGGLISDADDIPQLLSRQLIQPVQFVGALGRMAQHATLLVELGPGSALTRLARDCGLRAMAVDSQSDDLMPLLSVLAAVFAAGHMLDHAQLFGNRGIRPFDAGGPITLLSNPCGTRTEYGQRAQALQPSTLQVPETAAFRAELSAPLDDAPSPYTLDHTILNAIAEETGLPLSAIHTDARFQSDLHLNSLAVTRIVATVCRRLGWREVRNPTDFVEATPAMLASQLAEMALLGPVVEETPRVNGIRRWAAPYGMVWHPCDLPASGLRWIRWSSDQSAVENATDEQVGLLITLRDRFVVDESIRLVATLQQAAGRGIRCLAVVHDRLPVSSFFRSLHQEGAFETVLLIDRNGYEEDDIRVGGILSIARHGVCDYRLAGEGRIESAVFERIVCEANGAVGMPTAADVVLAVGCHRGIGAECAFALASNRARLVFVGRSDPAQPAVVETLKLARSRGIESRYEPCDVTDPSSVAMLARKLRDAGLSPTVLLFAPGVNQPMRLGSLTPKIMKETLAPKTEGLAAVLDRFGMGLRQLIAFGSIIGRIGLEGECHYALANALQSRIVEDFACQRPSCRCLSLEWTVWSGAGMGERLGTIERLASKGVDALPFDEALAAFGEHLSGGSSGTVAITGRFGPPTGLDIGSSEQRPLRFIDRILINFPGTELIVETELNYGRDPYLSDHRLEGRALLPGVLGIEAMAQAVAVLVGEEFCRRVSDVTFHHAAFVERCGLRIRVAALRVDETKVDAAVFTEADDFRSPCFSARFQSMTPSIGYAELAASRGPGSEVGTANSLYGPLFFHGRRFRKLDSIHCLTSCRVEATLGNRSAPDWFGAFEPPDLVFTDPGIADAALHVLQAAIPHRRVLPVSIDELALIGQTADATRIVGVENWTRGFVYSFDIVAYDGNDDLVAFWKGVQFKAIGEIAIEPSLKALPALCQSYLERVAREELGDETLRLSLVRNAAKGKSQRRKQALDELGLGGQAVRRADGRPMLAPGRGFLGLSHAAAASLAVHGAFPVACDIAELDASYPSQAGHRLTAEDWAAAEVLRKLGQPSPFSAGSVLGALSPGPIVFTQTLPVLGLAVSVGALRGADTISTSKQSLTFIEVAK
ncbi:polyketide synthase dehydratase domain-containing protein [Rhizobium sp. 1AS11]|uniref:type I polyketide synthase n=1 Tax=Rhizobium acaciae TaxID=2989736 RepID=UPI00222150BA|nr:type I polyketide synthase [Rhizobium acaciae]MCW1408221.1 polyketide synthase dehydratase domain-containing protein [Rhizobium acaciae]MCW1740372.1 polyketide synthase dehydratase domain-containing protein [Rhizobium acaciae]